MHSQFQPDVIKESHFMIVAFSLWVTEHNCLCLVYHDLQETKSWIHKKKLALQCLVKCNSQKSSSINRLFYRGLVAYPEAPVITPYIYRKDDLARFLLVCFLLSRRRMRILDKTISLSKGPSAMFVYSGQVP